MKLSQFLSNLLDYIFYRKCYICSKKCFEISLCNDCIDNIFSNLSFYNTKKLGVEVYAGGIYAEELLKIIRALKYHKKSEFEKILADIIVKTIKNYNLKLEDYTICPVPIHENRLKKRRYNHMELVANSVAKELSINVNTEFIKRVKDTDPLYKLSIPDRKKTIDGAFIVTKEVKDKNIILLDDIITSGTTIREISKLLLENGAKKVIAITATRAKSFI